MKMILLLLVKESSIRKMKKLRELIIFYEDSRCYVHRWTEKEALRKKLKVIKP